MTTEVIESATVPPAGAPTRRWEGYALLGILALAAVLYCWSLGDRTLQPYYAAGVHSMTENAKAFLFAGYDQSGVVSIDKTPLAFWVQGVAVWIFGYHWWAIALVQAIEGVAAVFVLHRVVRRWAGERTALLAALILAISPISTAIDRENQADALMVLLLLIAAYLVTRAVERAVATGRGTALLVWAGVFVGLAFFAKMLAAWIVLPALAIAYLAAPISWPKRVLRLLYSGVACAVVSLAWITFVSLWPAADRPYVGSSTNDSIWQLVFGYNGFGRVGGGANGPIGSFGPEYGSQFSGAPGPLRLFGADMADQIGWLLPLALAAVLGAVVVWARNRGVGTPTGRAGWLLWGGWLIVAGLVLSFAGGVFHRYYTVELAPAIAALAAIGLAYCWRWYQAGQRAGWLLPLAVLGTVGFAYLALTATPNWQPWLRLAIVVVGVLATAALVVAFPGRRPTRFTPGIVAVAIVAMLAGPLAFSVQTMLRQQDAISAADPSAGPSTSDVSTLATDLLGPAAGQLYSTFINESPNLSDGQRQVLDYVTRHAPDARIQLGVELGSWGADPYLLNSPARVAAFGGYDGLDPSPTAAQLASWAGSGQLAYVLLPAPLLALGRAELAAGDVHPRRASLSSGDDLQTLDGRINWLSENCSVVRSRQIGPGAPTAGVLFNCQR